MKPWIWPGPFRGAQQEQVSATCTPAKRGGGWGRLALPSLTAQRGGRSSRRVAEVRPALLRKQLPWPGGSVTLVVTPCSVGGEFMTGDPQVCLEDASTLTSRERDLRREGHHTSSPWSDLGSYGRRSSLRDGRAERVGFSATLPNQAIVPGYPIPGSFWQPGASTRHYHTCPLPPRGGPVWAYHNFCG